MSVVEMALPSTPGLERRLAYGEMIRSRYNTQSRYRTHLVSDRVPWAYQVLSQIPHMKVGLTLGEIFYNSKIYVASKECFCPICQDHISNKDIIRELTCKHIFHIGCIDRWLSEHDDCPLCKVSFKLNK